MPKGPTLTSDERDEILSLRAANMSARDIAKKIDRSKTVVLNFLKNPAKYGTVKRSGRKRALTRAQEEQIYNALRAGYMGSDAATDGDGAGDAVVSAAPAAAGKLSAERIKREFGLPLSTRRIQQLLSDWRRMTRKELDQQHALVEEVVEQGVAETDGVEQTVGGGESEVVEATPPSAEDMEEISGTTLELEEAIEASQPTEEAVV